MQPFLAEIYNRDFKNFMNSREFLHFVKKMELIKINKPGTHLCKSNTIFSSLYYVAKIKPGYKLCITSMTSDYKIKDIIEGSWIGIIEYTAFDEHLGKKLKLKRMTGKTRRFDVLWGINCYLEKIGANPELVNHPVINQAINERNEAVDILTGGAENANDMNLNAANKNAEVIAKSEEFSKLEQSKQGLSDEDLDGVLIYKIDLDVK